MWNNKKCIFCYITVSPLRHISMLDRNTHQSDQINRRDIIFITLFVLTVICPACIAHAPLEPICLRIALYFHNECNSICTLAHEVISELLADIQNLDHLILVVLIPEKGIETSQAKYVCILLLLFILLETIHNPKRY